MPGSWLSAAIAFAVLGLAMGTELDACAYLCSRHFGMQRFGAVFGTINGLLMFGNAAAPVIANYGYDLTHSYEAALWALIPVCLLSAFLFFSLGPYQEALSD